MTWTQVTAMNNARSVAIALGYPVEDLIGCTIEPTREVIVMVRASDGSVLQILHDEWEVEG